MKTITKRDTYLYQKIYGKFTLFFSLPFLLIGLLGLLAFVGLLPMPPMSDYNGDAPPWILATMAGAFFLAGLVLFILSVRGLMNRRRARLYIEQGIGEEAFVDYPWEQNRSGINDKASKRWIKPFTFAIFMVIFLAPFNWIGFVAPKEGGGGGHIMFAIVAGIFDVVVVIVFLTAMYQLLQYLKFGTSRLKFRDFPFRPGGFLRVAFGHKKLDKIDVTFRFVEEKLITTQSGGKSRTSHEIYELYSDKKVFSSVPGTVDIEIDFPIPEAGPDSGSGAEVWKNSFTPKGSKTKLIRYWEVLIESPLKGIDFKTTFPVPVY